MADFPLVSTGGGNRAASTTYYSPIGTTQAHSLKTTEDAAANREWKNAGTFSKLAVVLSANTRGSSTVTFRVNGADGNQTVAISASGTGQFQDTSNSDTIAANDAVCLKEVTGSGGSSHAWQSQSLVFSGDSPRLYAAQFNSVTGSATHYASLAGRANATTAENNASQVAPRAAGTLRNLAVHPDAFSGTSTAIVSRVNGADGNMTITATSTALVEDTANSDTVTATDLINFKITYTSVTGYRGGPQVEWLPSTTDYPAIHGTEAGAFTIDNAIQYWPMVSSANRFSTENSIQTTYDAAVTLSYLYLYVGSASLTGSSTITSRLNNADGNMTLTSINATGTYEDTSNSDSVTAGDRTGLKSTALTSGSARTDLFRVVVAVPASGSTESGAFSAAGTASASFTGASTAAGAASGSGVGAASFTGASTAAGPAASSGAGAAAFVGASIAAAAFSMAGAGDLGATGSTGTGSSTSAAGVASAAFVGASTAAASTAPAGVAASSFVGASIAAGVFSMAGSATMSMGGEDAAAPVVTVAHYPLWQAVVSSACAVLLVLRRTAGADRPVSARCLDSRATLAGVERGFSSATLRP